MRICDLKPGTVSEFEQRFADVLAHRQQFSKLSAFWHTEIGPLNRVIQIWPYENTVERDRLCAVADRPGVWPPDLTDLIVSEETKFVEPAPFSPTLHAAQIGLYEIRTYTMLSQNTDEIVRLWAPLMERRLKLSPCVFVGASVHDGHNEWIHVWGYKDLAERALVRAEMVAKKIWWPPVSVHLFSRQENMIVAPAAFSPLR
jgi:hypothetical protein